MRLVAALVLAVAVGAGAAARAADRRVAVDPNEAPWNAVAKVQTNTGAHCTGVLIGPTAVLTAAHCLYNRRTGALLRPMSLHVLFGYARGLYRWHRLVARIAVGPGFDGGKAQPQTADWATLDLAEPVPLLPLHFTEAAIAPGTAAALAGYNQDRAELLVADTACHVRRIAPQPDHAAFLLHDCAATRGTSGAPLVVRGRDGWALAGVNIAAGRDVNLALRPAFAR